MSINTEALNDAYSLMRIKRAHQALMSELDLNQAKVVNGTQARKDFIRRANAFLNDMKNVHSQITSASEYAQLCELANEWQLAFSTILDEPHNVREHVGLTVPPETLVPDSCRVLREQDVDEFLHVTALSIARARAINKVLEQIANLQLDLGRIERSASSSFEMEGDWYLACVHFATRVLYGKLRFASQIPGSSYRHLQSVWLDDVKRVRAYLSWEEQKDAGVESSSEANYAAACSDLEANVLDPTRKERYELFERLDDRFESKYLLAGRIDWEKAHPLITRKAYHLWEVDPHRGADHDWRVASEFVCQFYENIGPAVRERNHASAAEVLTAIRRHDITSAFELSIVMSFMDADMLNELLDGQALIV